MPHDTPLLAYVTAGLALAVVAGLVAARLRIPPIVGYMLAGVLVGPATPGFTADQAIATELAELGVILLMFGVGIHFSFRDLLAVRGIALPGAAVQIAVATFFGAAAGMAWGWTLTEGIVLGLAVSVASTVVLIRALVSEGTLESVHGRVAVGWLIVEDLATVLVLVMLPVVATLQGVGSQTDDVHPLLAVGEAVGKVAILIAVMAVAGVRVVPWILKQVARVGSRELFTMAVLAVALGIAYESSEWFEVSFALGAFLAGIVVGESDQSHQAAAEALPFRDAFAVLFFVSVGMLFDPATLIDRPLQVLVVVGIVIIIKPLTALLIVVALKYPLRTGVTVAAGLAQIGEFSFILAEMGRRLELLPAEGYDLVLAGALISIAVNPLVFATVEPLERWLQRHPRMAALGARGSRHLTDLADGQREMRNHAVLCGFGRVGSLIAEALDKRGFKYVVVELNQRVVEDLRRRGVPAIYGDVAHDEILERLSLPHARILILAVPDAYATRRAAEHAREINPRIDIVARTHSDAEWLHLRAGVVNEAVLGERELAIEMTRYTLQRYGVSAIQATAIAQGLRRRP